MFKRVLGGLLGVSLFGAGAAFAQTSCPAFPYSLTNGTAADANQVMADFAATSTCVHSVTSGGTLANTLFSGPILFGTSVANTPYTFAGPSGGLISMVAEFGAVGGAAIGFNFVSKRGGTDTGDLLFLTTQDANGAVLAEKARLTNDGNLLVGTTNSGINQIEKAVALGGGILNISTSLVPASTAIFAAVNTGNYNLAATGIFVGVNTSTNRSINAGGTINAQGADYAEYEHLGPSLTAASLHGGQVIGFGADGKVTASCKDSISFGVVSSSPSYVGGDSWGTEAAVGKFPAKPMRPRTASATPGSPEAALVPFDQAAAFNPQDPDIAQFYRDAAAWTDKFKAAEQQVAIIAYSGKVPVDVTGAHPGDYIVPGCSTDDKIIGSAVAANAASFEQFRKAVGQVRTILADGRAQIAVGR